MPAKNGVTIACDTCQWTVILHKDSIVESTFTNVAGDLELLQLDAVVDDIKSGMCIFRTGNKNVLANDTCNVFTYQI